MNQKSMINDLTQGNVARQLIYFSIPFILSNLLQAIYNIVDMIVIGQFVGSAGLSAVSIGSDLVVLMTMLCSGFSISGQIIISQYVGTNDRESISRTIGTMFTMMLSGAIVLSILCCRTSTLLLRFEGTPPEAWDGAMAYTITCYLGLVFIFGYNIVSAILRGMGDGKRPLYFIAVASIVNLILDLIFVAGLKMGAFGAALATVLAQAISFIVSLVYLYTRREAFGFDFRPASFRPHKLQAVQLCKMGIPMALEYAAIMVSVILVNAYVNRFGVVVSAVNGVGGKLRNLGNIIFMSLSSASATMCGQNLGAKKFDRVRLVVNITLAINVAYCTLLGVVLLGFPEKVFAIFTSDVDVIAMAGMYMPVAIVSFAASATMCPYNSLINGLGYARLSMIIGLLDSIVARISLSIALGHFFGLSGYWYGNAIAGFVTTILAAIYFYSGRWKTRKLLVE